MTNDALELLRENADYAALLRAYERARSGIAQDDADDDDPGWVPRLVDVSGIDDARLAPMHGKLIAHGLLNFRLTGRTSGVVYRVSTEGREILRRIASSASASEGADGEFAADVAA